jgi:TetR/AcrR family transcriptional regulator, regulator of cefoperazone and chloramphenicol sensitivity
MKSIENVAQSDTRRRLLDAAGEIFAEKGFEKTTIREICRNSGANVAAVNYHFGNKRRLYTAVFEHLRIWTDEYFQFSSAATELAETRLREFVRQYLRRLLDPGRPSWHGRLLAREMIAPSEAFDELIRNEFRPQYEVLQGIIWELAGDVPPRVIAKCTASVLGQMSHYHFARPVLRLVSPVYGDLEKHVEELADHVTRFSLAGIIIIADRYRK